MVAAKLANFQPNTSADNATNPNAADAYSAGAHTGASIAGGAETYAREPRLASATGPRAAASYTTFAWKHSLCCQRLAEMGKVAREQRGV
jgi:hypothetical protein